MEIRFKVNQAEAFRRGVSVPKSIVRLEIEPKDLPKDIRNLIADRMDGIDICTGTFNTDKAQVEPMYTRDAAGEYKPRHIVANLPTLEGLIEAVKLDQEPIDRLLNGEPD